LAYLRVGNASDGGDFLFIPARNRDDISHWSWRAIEPVYAKKHSAVKELEVERVSHLRYPVHPVANHLLRKWSVMSPRRIPGVIARELVVSAGQAVVDRNLGGVRGRIDGLRAGRRAEPYPPPFVVPEPTSFLGTLRRRWRRRARLRRGAE